MMVNLKPRPNNFVNAYALVGALMLSTVDAMPRRTQITQQCLITGGTCPGGRFCCAPMFQNGFHGCCDIDPVCACNEFCYSKATPCHTPLPSEAGAVVLVVHRRHHRHPSSSTITTTTVTWLRQHLPRCLLCRPSRPCRPSPTIPVDTHATASVMSLHTATLVQTVTIAKTVTGTKQHAARTSHVS